MPKLERISKKRKRAPENESGERSQKRVALSGNTKSAIISTHPPRSKDLGPILVSTPYFSAPKNVKFKAYQKPNATGRPEVLLHSSDHPRLDYIAREEKSSVADSLLKHYVAVYDAKSGDLKIREVPKVTLQCTLRPSERELNEMEPRAARLNYAAQRKALGMEFGTKKAKKSLSSLTENAVSRKTGVDGAIPSDSLTSAVLEGLAKNTSHMTTREEKQAAVDAAKPRPKPNLAAASPAQVYPLEMLIGEEDLKSVPVKDWQDSIVAKEEVLTSSRFVSHRLAKLVNTTDNIMRLKALRYVYMLVTFYNALTPGREGSKKLPDKAQLEEKVAAPVRLLAAIRSKFADGSSLTRWHVDRLLLHILALTLAVDDFVTEITDIREDLRLDPKQIKAYYCELGCKVAAPTDTERAIRLGGMTKQESKSRLLAKLRLPLVFPKERNIQQRKKR